MSGQHIKQWQHRYAEAYPKESCEFYKDAEITDLRAALAATQQAAPIVGQQGSQDLALLAGAEPMISCFDQGKQGAPITAYKFSPDALERCIAAARQEGRRDAHETNVVLLNENLKLHDQVKAFQASDVRDAVDRKLTDLEVRSWIDRHYLGLSVVGARSAMEDASSICLTPENSTALSPLTRS